MYGLSQQPLYGPDSLWCGTYGSRYNLHRSYYPECAEPLLHPIYTLTLLFPCEVPASLRQWLLLPFHQDRNHRSCVPFLHLPPRSHKYFHWTFSLLRACSREYFHSHTVPPSAGKCSAPQAPCR